MSLADILSEIKKYQPYANEDVESGAIETLNGRRGRKAQAIERLKSLEDLYRREMLSSTAFVLVNGSHRDEVVKVGLAAKLLSSDPEQFYKDLASKFSANHLGRESLSTIFDILGRHLEEKARNLGVAAYPMVLFKEEYRQVLHSHEDFVTLLKRAINDQMGSEIVGVQAIHSLTKPAIESGHKKDYTIVLLASQDQTLLAQLSKDLLRITRDVFLVNAVEGEEKSLTMKNEANVFSLEDVSDKSIKSVFKKISTLINK